MSGGDAVTLDEVRRIAALARLRPDEAAAGELARDLNRILEHVATLAEADVSEVEEPIRLPDEPVPFRDPTLEPDALDEGAPGDRAPRWEAGFFVVPRIPGVDGGGDAGS